MKFVRFVLLSLLVLFGAEETFAAKPAQITRFSLHRIDKRSVKTVSSDLKSGGTFDLAKLPTKQVFLRVKGSRAQRIDFTVAGISAVDGSTISLSGSAKKDGALDWVPDPGTYVITAFPSNKGVLGQPRSVELVLNDSSLLPSDNDRLPNGGVNPPPTPEPSTTTTSTSTTSTTSTSTTTTSSTTSTTTTTLPRLTTTTTLPKPTGRLSAFPAAEGFGSLTPGGSGRHINPPATTVYRVKSLADSGANTLRECVDANRPRVCIFETSGRIALKTPLVIRHPYITIAGQTAPSPGIMITDASVRVNTHDVVIRHLEIRIGDSPSGPDPAQRDGVTIAGTSSARVYNVVLDHLSISWGIDENLGIGLYVNDITISNSIISEALYNSIHPKGPHSKGLLVGDFAQNISIHHNLLAHNQDRNPRIKPGTSTEFISNFVYNWGGGSSGWNEANIADTENTGVPSLLNFIGNNYKVGADGRAAAPLYGSPVASGSRAYVLSNIGPVRTSESMDDWKISTLPSGARSTAPVFPLSGVTPHSGLDTPKAVLTRAGSRPREQNAVDNRVKTEARNGTGRLKDCLVGCSKPAGDFPEKMVISRSLVLPSNINGDDNNNGYTNLEDWLEGFAAAVE